MKNLLAFVCVSVMLACAGTASAMPTQPELSKVQPEVNKRMNPVLKDYKAKKRSAAEVGDAAMAFAAETDTQAAKFLLMKGAVVYYSRAKDYEKAADAVEAIIALVPDITPKALYEITSKAAAGATNKTAPRLIAINNAAKKGTVVRAPVNPPKQAAAEQAKSTNNVCRAKMEAIKIPEISFMPPNTLSDAIEYLRRASIDFGDRSIPITKRGLNFVIVTESSSNKGNSGTCDIVMPRVEAKAVSLHEALTLVCKAACLKFEAVDDNTVVVFSESFDYGQVRLDSTKNAALSKKVAEAMKKVRPVELYMKPPATIADAAEFLKSIGDDYVFTVELDAGKMDGDYNSTSRVWVSAVNVTLYDALRFICLSSSARFEFLNEKTIIVTDLPAL